MHGDRVYAISGAVKTYTANGRIHSSSLRRDEAVGLRVLYRLRIGRGYTSLTCSRSALGRHQELGPS